MIFSKNAKLLAQFYFLFALFLQCALADSVIDDVTGRDSTVSYPNAAAIVKERVARVSESRKIFIITNDNASFDKGDFISILLDNNLVARAIVAKNTDGMAGIKVVKIYSTEKWPRIKKGKEIQVLKGDDSSLTAQKKNEEVDDSKIKDEEDLYIDEKITLNEESNRIIKPDNVVSLSYGMIEALDNDGSSQRYAQPLGSWAYQVADNFWAEISYGQNIINDYPSAGLDTKLTNLSFKGKYAFNAPFYSYFLPYVGYQLVGADSPGAGVEDPTDTELGPEDYKEETDKVNALKKEQFIFGVTILKRLVPGWFIRGDLGSDVISVGAALEF